MLNPAWKYINIALKIALIVGFALSLFGDLQTVVGKGMEFRAPFFIFGSFFIFIIATLKKQKPYPHFVDAVFTLPFVLDTYGNIFGFFDSWRFYDDFIHAINWICFVLVFMFFNARRCSTSFMAFLLGAGFGALLIICWEIAEWVVSVDGVLGVAGLRLSYEDTVGDLFTSTLGGVLGAIIGTKAFKQGGML